MAKNKILLKEHFFLTIDPPLLKEYQEAIKEGQPIIVKGIIQRADAVNQNKRIYPYDILKKQCDEYFENNIKNKVALGELDHRDEPIVYLQNVSHILENLEWQGKDVYGTVRLLNTPAGKIAQSLVSDGIPLGISSRALGSVSKNEAQGVDIVDEDLQIVCWDLVSNPSTNHAYLKMYESRQLEKRDCTQEIIKDLLKL
jgi:hypothetical protein